MRLHKPIDAFDSMKRITFATLFALCVSSFATADNARLHGTVTSSGERVSEAYVLLYDYSEGSPLVAAKWELRTTDAGEFSISIPAGCYDVFVSATFIKPQSKRVCVEDGEVKRLQMKASPDRVLRIHDRF